MKTSAQTDHRFKHDAGKYAAYLDTAEGRLRLDLTLANLEECLPQRPANDSWNALDLGSGTGAAAIRLAQLGLDVVIALDSSPVMLEMAERAAREAGLSDSLSVKLGDAAQAACLFSGMTFDLILCHNLLEYVDDPGAVLCGAARVMRGSSALLSVLVRSQVGEVLKAAVQAGDLARANDALTAEWGQESLYGGKARLFTLDHLRNLLKAASFRIVGERGVRVITDYLPPQISRTDEYERIFELERKLGDRTEFAAMARYIHVLARPATQ